MLLAVDAYYDEAADRAIVAGVVFASWPTDDVVETMRRGCAGLAPYQPGEFYRRELPCLAPLVEAALGSRPIATVIVDGFVDLAEGRAGLGRHLYEAFGRAFEVVGVAKSPFVGSSGIPVCRGISTRPLWVTATGDSQTAAANVRAMAGEHRVPTLLRIVDQLTRKARPP